jgi:hypothetical protein
MESIRPYEVFQLWVLAMQEKAKGEILKTTKIYKAYTRWYCSLENHEKESVIGMIIHSGMLKSA